ncbi:MAG: 8-amino-7-oxononanoate synthase [Magnetococcales bacterium]|nr:8-amino-7-oxononanoate synthase [Magnetococcales bacterium]
MAESIYSTYLKARKKSGLWRSLRPVGVSQQGRTILSGESVLNFSSNDYMGLASHPALKKKSRQWIKKWGAGSTASRLVCGNMELFEQVEGRLVAGKGSEAALVFSSGFGANSGILSALLDRQVLKKQPQVFSDRLNHASMHHGLRAAGVRQIRYRHNDLDHLEELLKKSGPGPKFILSETVFSMDGDRADVAGLLSLKERYGAFLYLDEAHAAGVLGPAGLGLATEFKGRADLVMGTFSKGLGGFGAYAACSQDLKDFLINHCSSFIFATALPPGVLGSMAAALDLLPSMAKERRSLLAQGERLRTALRGAGLDVGYSSTQIVPVILGDNQRCIEVSRRLEKKALLGIAIRPPAVPAGKSRLRLSLTANHSSQDIDKLIQGIIESVAEVDRA